MIPILSGLIAGAGTRIGTRRALWLSFIYVLASALVFTVAGVVAGLVGANLQVAFQVPWVIALFALLFVALALSSFGLYELQLPAALRSKLGRFSDRQRGGSLAGVAARSEEHTSELQSLMRISYAVFCLKKKTKMNN